MVLYALFLILGLDEFGRALDFGCVWVCSGLGMPFGKYWTSLGDHGWACDAFQSTRIGFTRPGKGWLAF